MNKPSLLTCKLCISQHFLFSIRNIGKYLQGLMWTPSWEGPQVSGARYKSRHVSGVFGVQDDVSCSLSNLELQLVVHQLALDAQDLPPVCVLVLYIPGLRSVLRLMWCSWGQLQTYCQLAGGTWLPLSTSTEPAHVQGGSSDSGNILVPSFPRREWEEVITIESISVCKVPIIVILSGWCSLCL